MKAWTPVTRARPCPRCGHDSWCAVSKDRTAVMCMRDTVGFDERERTNKAGEPYGFHWIDGARRDPSAYVPAGPSGPEPAPPEDRDRVYRALLDALALSDQHRQHLRHRGLSPDHVAALQLAGYRTLPDDGHREPAIRAAATALGTVDALAIPGLYRAKSGKSLRLAGRAGLVIPVRDVDGHVVALKLRPDDPGDGGKYVWLSAAHMEGSSPGAPAHVARREGDTLRIVEGVLKADVAAALDPGVAVIGIPSCSASSAAVPALRALRPARVLLAWDADARANVHVARGLERAVVVVREVLPQTALAVETWGGDAKGLDDALATGAPIVARADVDAAVAEIIAASQPATSQPAAEPAPTPAVEPVAPGTREGIRISDREHEVNDLVLAELVREPDLYVRGGALARVALDPSPVDARPPRIEDLPRESLRELVTRRVCFLKVSRGKDGEPREERVHPPDWCIAALHRRGAWPGLRPLTGVIDAPVLRRDGSVLATPGYDPGTGLFFAPRVALPPIPERPTPDDGSAAVARLVDMLSEFPFDATSIEGDAEKSWQLNLGAALALVLTLVARPMIAGPVPGFLIDAPDAGAGKTLLAKVLALMGTGHLPDAERWHVDEDEWAKVHLGNLLEGRRVVFFDNVTTGGTFGHSGLDAALTQWPLWKGRILGQTGNVAVRNDALVVATGNNPRVPNDTIRRLVRIRLRPDEERRAETELAYRHRLPGDAVRSVADLLAAAVTALRAWICAGRPVERLTPWGSFEEWAGVVPQCLAWYGFPDVHRTQDGLRAADDGTDALAKLLAGWRLYAGDEGASPTATLNALRVVTPIGQPRPPGLDLIREGLEGVDPKRTVAQHNPMTVGRLLGKFEGKIVRGRRFMRSARRGDATVWLVQELDGAEPLPASQENNTASGGAHGFMH